MKAKMESNQASLAVIGIDIGKEVFHIVGLGVDGKIAFRSAHSDDVGRAFRLMSATCSDRSRPAVPIDVGRVAERPLVGGDLCITGCIGSSGDGFRSLLLA